MSSQPSGSVRSRRSRTREEGKRRQQQTSSSKQQASNFAVSRAVWRGRWQLALRRDAEELERSRSVHNLTLLLAGTDTPSGRLLASRQSNGQFLGAGLRASTLRGKVRNLRKFMAWLATTRQEVFPTSTPSTCKSGSQNRRTEEPTKPATLLSSFSRKLPGLPAERKQTSTELYTFMYKEVLSQATPGRPVRQTSRMFVRLLAEIETLVVDPSKQTYLRIIGWWILLQSWGTLSQGTTSASQERGRSEPCTNSACAMHCRTWTTIPAKIITEMRGADYIVFRINLNGKIRNSMRFLTFSN